MYGEMVLDYFNLNRPGMINFWPIMIIRKVKENIILVWFWYLMLLKHLCIQKTESERVIVGT